MSTNPTSPDRVLPLAESQEPDVDVITTNEQPKQAYSRPLRSKNSHRSVPTLSSMLRSQSASGSRLFNSLVPRTMTHRQKAEIQLESILNDPEAALPAFARRASDNFDDEISVENASKLLNTQPFIIKRIVNALKFSKDDEDIKVLDKAQVQKLTRVLNGTLDVRAFLFFMMLDENSDGFISDNELSQFYEEYLRNLKTFDNNRSQEVSQVLLQKFHLHDKSRIDFEEFYTIVSKDSTLLASLSQFTVEPTWFIKSTETTPKKQTKLQQFLTNICWQQSIYEQQKNKLTWDYVKDNFSRIIVLTLYILINLALLLYVVIYRSTVTKSNGFVVFARIGGMLLNFNCALIIVLMLKQTILLIRSNKLLRKLIPVDDHIDFHKVVGRVITGLAILHTIAHMANFGTMTSHSWGTYMFTTTPDIGWIGGFAPLSGVILWVILAIIVVFSMQWIRRGGHFQLFYWTHLLYLPFFIFLILHAGNFWKWIIGPLSLFLIEKAYSILKRYSSSSGRTYLRSVTIEQSNVISLNIHRPKNFTFRPGDYLTINIPSVTLYEFHPFTISSAPERIDQLTIHIQAVGNWTKQVYQYFLDMSESTAEEKQLKIFHANRCDSQLTAAELQNEDNQDAIVNISRSGSESDNDESSSKMNTKLSRRERVVINGPYSSCARYVFDCKHVVLIGGGIGITPYASILSSLMEQFRASRIVCSNCQHINYHRKGLIENRRLRKVDFIWVNRDQKNFEWFLNLLRQFEQEQEYYLASNSNEQRFLDIHLYFTEIKHEENIGNVPLDVITKVWAQIAGQDIFTSLKSKTHVGRPKWEEIFDELISDDNASTADDVNVFFCGPATMAQAIRSHCVKYRFRFYEEKF
ncbi:unnamed protein product [Adineta ricciae]|uniref:Uncharacterized protein n=1 Tax=Adineta ricciae TaxID=249248 RepID=A0A814X0A5_ADIRI|nr:unnamed protein product [Adineta ricciae]